MDPEDPEDNGSRQNKLGEDKLVLTDFEPRQLVSTAEPVRAPPPCRAFAAAAPGICGRKRYSRPGNNKTGDSTSSLSRCHLKYLINSRRGLRTPSTPGLGRRYSKREDL